VAQKRKSAFQISYVTITYRSVLMGMFGVLLLAGVVMYFAFPDTANKLISSGQIGLGKVLTKMGVSNGTGGNGSTTEPGPQQAHFTNIDGNVRVRKASTNAWVVADYTLALERGDVVQTSPEGLAKVVFTDGTNYTVKPGSLITIQENSVNSAQQTKVAVQVTTGKVDLNTSMLNSGSKSQVIVGDATATIASESSAEVVNDIRADQHEILVKKGAGEVTREGQTLPLESYTKASFSSNSQWLATASVATGFRLGTYSASIAWPWLCATNQIAQCTGTSPIACHFGGGTGDYLVHVAAAGYETFRKRVTRAGADTVFVVDASLRSTAVQQLAPVVTTARKPKPDRNPAFGADLQALWSGPARQREFGTAAEGEQTRAADQEHERGDRERQQLHRAEQVAPDPEARDRADQ
jgi:hypothetical protein